MSPHIQSDIWGVLVTVLLLTFQVTISVCYELHTLLSLLIYIRFSEVLCCVQWPIHTIPLSGYNQQVTQRHWWHFMKGSLTPTNIFLGGGIKMPGGKIYRKPCDDSDSCNIPGPQQFNCIAKQLPIQGPVTDLSGLWILWPKCVLSEAMCLWFLGSNRSVESCMRYHESHCIKSLFWQLN